MGEVRRAGFFQRAGERRCEGPPEAARLWLCLRAAAEKCHCGIFACLAGSGRQETEGKECPQ